MRLIGRRYSWVMCALAAGSALAATTGPYEILERKSIFAKDRVSRVPTTSYASTAPSLRAGSPILIGIVQDEQGWLAIFETPGAEIAAVRQGQAVPGTAAMVVGFDLNHVEVTTPGESAPRQIAIGRDTDGAEVQLAAGDQTGAAPTTSAPIEGDDVLSRMRRRRQQEMNR